MRSIEITWYHERMIIPSNIGHVLDVQLAASACSELDRIRGHCCDRKDIELYTWPNVQRVNLCALTMSVCVFCDLEYSIQRKAFETTNTYVHYKDYHVMHIALQNAVQFYESQNIV